MRLVQYAMVPHRGLFFSVCPLLVITVRINDMEASYAPACFIEFLRKKWNGLCSRGDISVDRIQRDLFSVRHVQNKDNEKSDSSTWLLQHDEFVEVSPVCLHATTESMKHFGKRSPLYRRQSFS